MNWKNARPADLRAVAIASWIVFAVVLTACSVIAAIG